MRIGRLEPNYKGVPLHYLITGHTGFKGAWLAMWLTHEGHEVSGLSLDPVPGALFETARVSELLKHDIRGDIRDLSAVKEALNLVKPDVVFHLAAQPLVRESYQDPRGTIETNVIGTMNLLSAVAETPSVKAHIVITTDKVYKNIDQIWGYKEIDPLGGDDPYSASKAMADILTQSWIKSFGGPPTAIARAGNVIGGGDLGKDRLIPDIIRNIYHSQDLKIRNLNSTRPWQHVLDPLNGYIMGIEHSLNFSSIEIFSLNFGPNEPSKSVGEILQIAEGFFGENRLRYSVKNSAQKEEVTLSLDSSKANLEIGWKPKFNQEIAVLKTLDWWKKNLTSELNAQTLCQEDIHDFLNL